MWKQDHARQLNAPIIQNSAEVNDKEIGLHMWKQLTRVSIPKFNGDKKTYDSWKAVFTACGDRQ